MRGSDPDAALYYLARMLYAGEDVKFIARRIIICAAAVSYTHLKPVPGVSAGVQRKHPLQPDLKKG